jgi:magnesium transporter
MLTDFVIYTNRKNINIKDNFDLVLKLLLSWVFGFEIPKTSQSKKINEDNLENRLRTRNYKLQIEKCLVFLWLHWRDDILLHRIKNIKSQKNILIWICWKM